MISSFAGIEVGKRGVITHTESIATVGHNLSNASVEGYSRQRVEIESTDPLYMPGLNREETPGQIGQGIQTQSILRVKDMMLESRIVAESSVKGYWDTRDKYNLMAEQVYNEPTDLSVRTMMDRFWESWQELSLRPSEIDPRKSVLERGNTLIDSINSRFDKLKNIRNMLDDDIKGTVVEFNSTIREIASLNEEIVKIKAVGDNPNDLLDRRDLLVNKLSEYADVTFSEKDRDEFTVYVGGMHVVQGRLFQELDVKTNLNNEGYVDVTWKGTLENANFRGGRLAGLIEMRDLDIRNEIQKLDTMTINFIDLVNEIHTRGYGLNKENGINFFSEFPFINNLSGNYDRNGDGNYDSSYIFRLTGTNKLNPREQIGLSGELLLSGKDGDMKIPYFPTDTVEDLVERINLSGTEVVARLNTDNRLSLKATTASDNRNPDFVIRHIEDSGQFLTGYAGILPQTGTNGAYDWNKADAVDNLKPEALFAVAPLAHPSGWIRINPELFKNPGSVASSIAQPYDGPGDGSAALAIASLRTNRVMIGQTATFDDYFASAIAQVGLKGEQAETASRTTDLILKELKGLRESISGVNIDEELANMIKFQHGYAAAARFITTFDEMLDIIINRMGV